MNSVPLTEALPWSSSSSNNNNNYRTIVVYDTIETEGRFVLHTLASQYLSSSSSSSSSSSDSSKGRVLWLACGPSTEKQVALAMKKMGCDVASSHLKSMGQQQQQQRGGSSRLKIISVTQDIAMQLSSLHHHHDDDDDETKHNDFESVTNWSEELFLQTLYKQIKSWLNDDNNNNNNDDTTTCVVLDDASTLATLLGDYLCYAFLQKLHFLSKKYKFRFVVRCCNDADVERYMTCSNNNNTDKTTTATTTTTTTTTTSMSSRHAKGSRDWVGSSSSSSNVFSTQVAEEVEALQSIVPPWERQLVEMADIIVDVLPLLSGFSREAHGRIVFTERLGGSSKGWRTDDDDDDDGDCTGETTTTTTTLFSTGSVVNYRCTDNGVMAFRLRS